jgi:hypothetical protein
MIKIISFIFGMIILGVLANISADAWALTAKPDGANSIPYILYGIIFTVWFGCLISDAVDYVRVQYKDYYSIDEYKMNKESYNTEMEQYKSATQSELLENFRTFEENLMSRVSDSKIIATVLQKSGYSKTLEIYESRVTRFLDSIHACDRRTAVAKKDMLVRQSDYMSGFAFLIPSKIKIERY